MRNFIANEYGRTLVIHLGKGELVLESIQESSGRTWGLKTQCCCPPSALCAS